MSELAVTSSEMREKFADYLENVERGRVLVRRHGQDRAYLISVQELRALEETIEVLANEELVEGLGRGLEDMKAGRVTDAQDAFAKLDAEFSDKD